MTTTSPLSTDEEPGPRRAKITSKLDEEATTQAEEATRHEPQPTGEEDSAAETTPTATGSTATSANFRGTGKRNAGSDSRRTSPAETLKDRHTGPRFTSWMKTQT